MHAMRLAGAGAAAAAALTLAPAGAAGKLAARPRAGADAGACQINLEAPAVVTFGESVTLFGHLSCANPAAAAGSQVRILRRTAPGLGPLILAGATSSEASGAFKFEATPTANTIYYAVVAGVASQRKLVRVAPAVTLEGPKSAQLFTGRGQVLGALPRALSRLANRVTFSGTVKPAYVGEVVALQRSSAVASEEWRRIAIGTVTSVVAGEGHYTIRHTFAVPGDANIRAVARPNVGLAPGASSALSYVISQAQNPALTIEAAGGANPILAGQSVTIQGVAAGQAGKTVTLLARGAGGSFAPVAQTTAGAAGAYKFTQAPGRNTYYRTRDAVTRSAVMFEGVKFVITPASAPASTAQQGAPLVFSGKVTPARAGHVIYLERQNPGGIGFHVVEVTTLAADGSYSLSRGFFTTGPVRLRVKIPGDPENQGASAPPVTVTITPAPPGSLGPLAPQREPGTGQL
jgi:hypothetical protein